MGSKREELEVVHACKRSCSSLMVVSLLYTIIWLLLYLLLLFDDPV